MLHADIQYLIKSQFPFQADFTGAVDTNESRVSRALRGRIKIRQDEAEPWASVIGCKVSTLASITRTENTDGK